MTEQKMEEILKELSEPFHPSRITWKPGVFNRDKTKALALAYADLRAYQNRLDEVCGMNWAVSYTPWGERIVCHLTINGVTRSSTGEPDSQAERSEIAGTAAEAQAFKRACAMFGLGRYLYNLPTVWAELDGEGRYFTEPSRKRLQGIVVQHYRRHMDPNAEPEKPLNGYILNGKGVSGNGSNGHDRVEEEGAPPVETEEKEETDSIPLHDQFDQLGREIYGEQWEQVRRHNVERISGGAAQDSKDLDEMALKKLINGLKKLKRQRKAA